MAENESYILSQFRKPIKRAKMVYFTPIMYGESNTRFAKAIFKELNICLDSGTSFTIIVGEFATKIRRKVNKTINWTTQGGNFHRTETAKVDCFCRNWMRQKW